MVCPRLVARGLLGRGIMRPRPLRSVQVSRSHSPTELACWSNRPAPTQHVRVLLTGKVCKRGVVPWSQALTMPFALSSPPPVADVPCTAPLYQPPGTEQWPRSSLCAEPDVSGAEGEGPKRVPQQLIPPSHPQRPFLVQRGMAPGHLRRPRSQPEVEGDRWTHEWGTDW